MEPNDAQTPVQFSLRRLMVSLLVCGLAFVLLREAYVRHPVRPAFAEMLGRHAVCYYFVPGYTILGAAIGLVTRRARHGAAIGFVGSVAFVVLAILT